MDVPVKKIIGIVSLICLVVFTMGLRFMPVPQTIILTVNNGTNNVYTNDAMATYDPSPGDTLRANRSFGSIRLTNLHGAPGNHIVIKIEDSVIIGGNATYCLNLDHISYVDIIGGHLRPDTTHAVNGISLGNWKHVRFFNQDIDGGADGFQAKTNVNSNPDSYYPTSTNEDLQVYDMTIKNARAECIYGGHTNSPGYVDLAHIAPPCIGATFMRIHLSHCGWDALQIAHMQNVYVDSIWIKDYGYLGTSSQWYGFIAGGASTFTAINNVWISKGPGPGFCGFNMGLTMVNNLNLDSVGRVTTGESGAIYLSNKDDYGQHLPVQKYIFNKVTVTGSGRSDLPVFKNLDGAPTPGTWRSDSGYIYDFVYNASDWPTTPAYGKTRPIRGNDGPDSPSYKYIIKPHGKRDKIKQ